MVPVTSGGSLTSGDRYRSLVIDVVSRGGDTPVIGLAVVDLDCHLNRYPSVSSVEIGDPFVRFCPVAESIVERLRISAAQ